VLSAQRYGCLAALAGQTKNVLYCNQIGNPGLRNSCVMSLAEGSGNVSECNAFGTGQQRTQCVENISLSAGNPSLCDGLDAHNQSACRYAMAERANFSQLSYCSGIRAQPYGGLCSAQSYYHLALESGNYSYCGDLPSGSNGTLVYYMMFQDPAYQSSSYGLSAGFLNLTPRDLCYSSVPAALSSGACAQISNSTLRSACANQAAAANFTVPARNATQYCANSNSIQLTNLCYFGIYANEALQTGNESWCGLIPNQSYTTTCVVNLASLTGNITYCGDIANQQSRQSCVYETQIANGNYT
jgi:hypothetical protein